MQKKMYDLKPINYYEGLRMDLIDLIGEQRALIVLEIGCGNGRTASYLKENGIAKKIYGIDLKELLNKKIFDGFIEGNIEEIEFPYKHNYFDLIIAGDILEHLIDPWGVLRKLKKYLKKDGILLASIPNICNYKILKVLIRDKDFKYVESGILDHTHLRFFAKQNIISMFESDFELLILKQNVCKPKWYQLVRQLIYIFDDSFFTVQYLVKVRNR